MLNGLVVYEGVLTRQSMANIGLTMANIVKQSGFALYLFSSPLLKLITFLKLAPIPRSVLWFGHQLISETKHWSPMIKIHYLAGLSNQDLPVHSSIDSPLFSLNPTPAQTPSLASLAFHVCVCCCCCRHLSLPLQGNKFPWCWEFGIWVRPVLIPIPGAQLLSVSGFTKHSSAEWLELQAVTLLLEISPAAPSIKLLIVSQECQALSLIGL